MAHLLRKELGSLMGGIVVDIMQAVTRGNALVSYSAVFLTEMQLLILARLLSLKIDIGISRARMEEKGLLAEIS